MNRLLLFLCCICVPWMTRGQSVYDWHYWFDTSYNAMVSGQTTGDCFTIEAEAQGLSEGFHAFYMQVADTAGNFSPPISQLFYHTTDHAIDKLHYWFDNYTSKVFTVSNPQGGVTIDVSHIDPGLHFIYCQMEDKAGLRSDVMCRLFYRQAIHSSLKWTYWFDEDETTCATQPIPAEVTMIDVSALQEGFHVLHNQVFDVTSSDITTTMFIKVPQTEGVGDMTCICTVDGKLVANDNLPAAGGLLRWDMNVDSLDVGIHKAMFQVITPTGAASSIAERYFVREITNKELGSMKCVYTIDNSDTYSEAGTLSNGLFHFDLDVASIEDGLHRIAYMLISAEGVTTPQKTAFFWKTPFGGDGIVQYDYWLNDDMDNMQSTKLNERMDPFKLVSLLPIENQPIRSSCFDFRISDGRPIIYAKNDIHIRFTEATGRFSDVSKQFVDESVKQEVTNIVPIYNGERKTLAAPEENGIHWFKFYAEEGDTVTFRTDQAATIQVFSPEGKEVYSSQGSTAVKYGGCHTWVDGTYYVALHDVTGSKPNISLDFTHLAKYDVVSYDVATVGDGGCSTITFKGNGFRDLYAVDFLNEANDTIHAFSIGHESDGTTSVTADFADAELGKYTALFHFTEGKKYVYDAITVEEAKAIELATEVTFPSSFGHVVTYTCKITNNGNMTAYAVPIYTWLKSKTKDGIYHIEYDGLDLPGLFDGIGTDLLSEADIAELKLSAKTLGDDHHFVKFWAKDEDNQEDSIYVRTNYFFIDIAPNETKTLRLTISTREVDAYAYFTVPEDWRVIHENDVDTLKQEIRRMGRRASIGDYYCCYKTHLECFLERFATGCDIAAPILTVIGMLQPELLEVVGPAAIDVALSGCMASLTNDKMKIFGKLFCASDSKGMKDAMDAIKNRHFSSSISVGSILSCVGATLSGLGANESCLKRCLSETGFVIGGGALDSDFNGNTSCSQTGKKQPGCPPPPPGGGGAQGGKSHDPNEIYGYLSESGSKFMTDEVEKVNYRIEFENDTVFATRSAMVVEIRDTLDSKLFDLSSYAPTGIKIGEKVEYLDGEQKFIRTIDMRPEINGLVEVEGKYDANKGIMTWLFTSIDPMTMEPTNDPMDGFLPVNTNGQGIGEVSYDIKLKQKMTEGTEIPNRASIVFDINDPILTPTWTNIVDGTAPRSRVTDANLLNDSTAAVVVEVNDELSGPWRYNIYVQYGTGAWFLAAENVSADTTATVKIYEGIEYHFYSVATDMAGNVEQKEPSSEFSLSVNTVFAKGDVNGDGSVNLTDASWIVRHFVGRTPEGFNVSAADVNGDGYVNLSDAQQVVRIFVGKDKNDN